MLSLLPPSERQASDPTAFAVLDVDELLNITDPWHRSLAADEHAKALEAQMAAALRIRRDAVGELVNDRRTSLSRVAAHLGLTKSRIFVLAKSALRALDGGDAR